MSEFEIRPTVAGDLPVIQSIYAFSVLNETASYEITPPSLDEMRGRFETLTKLDFPWLVAVDGAGTIGGFAYAAPYKPRPAYQWLVEDSIYLAQDMRGKGLGSLLLAELIGNCEQAGIRQMLAVIGGAAAASVALHRKHGFEQCGFIKASGHKHGRWLDTVLMQRSLGEGSQSEPQPAQRLVGGAPGFFKR